MNNITKNNRFLKRISCLSCVLLVSASSNVFALKPEEEQPLEARLRPNLDQSVDEIARRIRQQRKWRILAAEPTVNEEKTFYRFKLLNKKRGRVSIVVIDPSEPNLNTLN